MVKNPELKHWIKNLEIKKTVLVLPCPLCGEEVRIKRETPDEIGTIKALGDLAPDEVIKRCTIQNYNEETKDLHSRPYLYAYLKQKK
jgi:competence CoiA-like predicted nuclease